MRPRCPVCSRRTALVGSGKLAHHKNGVEWCKAGGLTTFEATILLAHLLPREGGHGAT